MTIRIGRCTVFISPLFAALIALLLASDHTGMMPLSLAAVLLHELGHLLMMRLTGQRVRKIMMKPGAVEIERRRSLHSPGRDAAVAAGGILMNALTAAAAYALFRAAHIPAFLYFAALSAALAGFSLCPVSGLDGGELLTLLLSRFFSESAALRILYFISAAMVLLIVAGGAALLLGGAGNISLLLCGLYLAILTLLSGKSRTEKRG